jgi:DNA repair protein RadD
MKVTPYPFQFRSIKSVRDCYSKGYRAPLLVSPTASGKTVTSGYIIEQTYKKGNSVWFLVHRQELSRQTSDHLELLGLPHGLVASGHSMTGDLIQIASVQTLVRRIDQIKRPPALIIIDEAHHANAETWRKIIEAWPKAFLLGLTATPIRLDGTGLGVENGGYFDIMVNGPSVRELIDQGYLAPPIIYAPPVDADLKGIKTLAGDFVQKEVAHRMDKPHITGCAIEHYQRICPGVPAIAFCATVAHAEHVAEQFNAAGIAAASLDAKLQDSVRKYRIQALANGQIKVLTSCDIVSEGTDIPVVTTAIMLRPTKSLGLYMQQGGRVLRRHPDKQYAIILDHVGNCMRHGLLDDARSWSLSGVKRKKKSDDEENIKVLRCPKCFRTVRFGVSVCPDCETIIVPLGTGSNRDIKQVDGNLIQVTKLDIERIKIQRRREVGMANSLEELLHIADERGYKRQWAYMAWNRRKMRHHSLPKHLQESMVI